VLGLRAIDGVLTCGEGQRMGIYGEPGGGKSSLLAQIVRGVDADVAVIALIGERGREVREFVEVQLGEDGMRRAVLVVSTSDRSAMERVKAAYVATAIAEHFRDSGKRVLLVMDSITRFARALREIGLAAGEPPTRRGFPPSVFAQLPSLMERAGPGITGSITAFYTVLVEGDGSGDPIAEETRGILDGHVILSRQLASAGHYPAIDVLASRSRVMNAVTDAAHQRAASRLRELLSRYAEIEFLLQVGEYKSGADPVADEAVAKINEIRSFLRQSGTERIGIQETLAWLTRLAG
jgi:type III secretion protein N (ATPase)